MGKVVSMETHTSKAPELTALMELVKSDMDRVNALILAKAGSHVDMIPQIVRHLVSSGGKRIRPMLTLACAAMCAYGGDGHVSLAASVEFMHTATLLHDDVIDESDMRRGKEAARLLWGNQASVLVGDYLLGQAFKMMVEVGSLDALAILSHAASVIAEGEVMQLSVAKDTATTEDDYLAVIGAKTATLFSASAEVGAVIAGAPRVWQLALRSYGANLGLAFQLVDDALDYGGAHATMGKNTGDDFREGKITLPVVLAYRRGTDAQRNFWERTLVDGEVGPGDMEQAVAFMRSHRAIEDTLERARHYGAISRDALAPLADSAHKRALLEVIDFCIARGY